MENFEILTEKNFNKLKEKVKKFNIEGKKIIFFSEDDELNRKVLEKLNINGLGVFLLERKDFMKQRNSGLNEVMVKIMQKKGIFLGVDFKEIVNSKNKEALYSRLKQNVELCKRTKVQIKFFNYGERDIKALKSFGVVFGMPTWMLKELI